MSVYQYTKYTKYTSIQFRIPVYQVYQVYQYTEHQYQYTKYTKCTSIPGTSIPAPALTRRSEPGQGGAESKARGKRSEDWLGMQRLAAADQPTGVDDPRLMSRTDVVRVEERSLGSRTSGGRMPRTAPSLSPTGTGRPPAEASLHLRCWSPTRGRVGSKCSPPLLERWLFPLPRFASLPGSEVGYTKTGDFCTFRGNSSKSGASREDSVRTARTAKKVPKVP